MGASFLSAWADSQWVLGAIIIEIAHQLDIVTAGMNRRLINTAVLLSDWP